MKKIPAPVPTKGEIEILQILWAHGPCTVRIVHEHFGRAAGYTTVLKLLQIMTEKGLVEREEEGRAHVYKALVSQKGTTKTFVKDIIQRVFGGSSAQLAMQALGSGEASAEELAAIRKLITEMEEKQK